MSKNIKGFIKGFLLCAIFAVPIGLFASQADYDIANQTFPSFRTDLNNTFGAVATNNSGLTEPTTTFAFQWWADTTTGLLKQRNAANSAFITIGTLADTNLGLTPLSGATLTGRLDFAIGANIPSLATTDISVATGNIFRITGTTNITAFTMATGQIVDMIFDNSLQLVFNSTTNKTITGSNIFTAGGDVARYFYDGTTVLMIDYARVSGNALVTNSLLANNANGPQIEDQSGTATNPTLIPNRSDNNTGIGHVSSDVISLIAGSNQTLAVSTTGLIYDVSANITAFAGGGQGSAVLLAKPYNKVATVVTAGDSVKLPTAVEGLDFIVINTGAFATDVFPNTADSINGQAVNTAVSVSVDQSVRFVAQDDTEWHTVGLSQLVPASLLASNAAGPEVEDAAATSTNPTLIPNRADNDTGVGWNAADVLSLIAGANETLAVSDTGLVYDVSANITAFAGGGQGSAVLLAKPYNKVATVVTAGDSVKLPTAVEGLDFIVINTGANATDVFPNTGDSINGQAVNLAVSVVVDQAVRFVAQDSTEWHSVGLKGGQAESLLASNAAGPEIEDAAATSTNPTLIPNRADNNTGIGWNAADVISIVVGGNETLAISDESLIYDVSSTITAFATGGQSSAVLLVNPVSRVTTVATNGDSVKLPSAAAGLDFLVINTGVASLDVFPNTSDTINGLAINLAISVGPDKTARFQAQDATEWHQLGQQRFRGALVAATSNQSITNNVATDVVWQTEDYDTDNIHDNSTNNSRLTVPSGVRFVRIICSIQWNLHFSGVTWRELSLDRNDGDNFEGRSITANREDVNNTKNQVNLFSSAVLKVTPGDYFECTVTQNSGSTRTLNSGFGSFASMEIID